MLSTMYILFLTPWLFCSHLLAVFLVFYLIQQQIEWNFDNIVQFMPEPIKSLQNLPLAASYVFHNMEVSRPGAKMAKKREKQHRQIIKRIANRLAADVPGYSGEWYKVNNDDAAEEFEALLQSQQESKSDVKIVDLCQKVDDQVKLHGSLPNNPRKVTTSLTEQYNTHLIHKVRDGSDLLQKYLRHERLYQLMCDGYKDKDNFLWPHLHRFRYIGRKESRN